MSCKRSWINLSDPSLQKAKSVSRPKPTAQPLPGKPVQPVAVAALKSTVAPRTPPPPPAKSPAPPPPPEEPDVDLYRAKFTFKGQDGEMALQKDDIVELVEKDNNGWWLVKKDGEEGWAPNNYLELVPKKPKAPPAASPPPVRRPPPSTPAAPSAPAAPKITAAVKSVIADVSAKPVAVFPGLIPSNGSATPWKKTTAPAGDPTDTTPTNSRPSSSLAARPPPPVVAKPKVMPPPVAMKPGAGRPPGKPPIPTAPRPVAGGTVAQKANVTKPSAPVGQMDLAAAVSIPSVIIKKVCSMVYLQLAKRAQKMTED